MSPLVFLFLDGVGGPEVLMVMFITLLLFGGKSLPSFARTLGKSIREFKRATSEVEREIRRAIDEAPEEPPRTLPKPVVKMAPEVSVPTKPAQPIPVQPPVTPSPTAGEVHPGGETHS